MLKRKQRVLTPEQMEEIRTKDFFDMILPGTVKIMTDHYIIEDSYRSVWVIREYPPSTEEQAILSQLADRSGVTLRMCGEPKKYERSRAIMQTAAQTTPPKVVHTIPATINLQEEVKNAHRQLRVAAYCRVSTKQEDQLNSYDVQRRAYTDKINGEPGWTMVGIYADKGITGTSVKKRDDFNRLMRHCKQGKEDMIITKSVARFARNTLDCLKHTRMLKEHNVDVYFEEQGIHSIQPGAEFYITIYGSIAQSESENISANVRWGKAQSAKEGNVPFHYKRFLGYRRGPDGKPEIDPEQAVVVKRIYERFLAGDSLATIANNLNADGIPTPSGIGQWQRGTIESILTNEKYKGDAILNKTYIRDCLSKKVMINNGERPKYYVENNHPAIIDSGTFGRVQEEMARRGGKRKVKQVGTKTEQGRYSSKYALTELLICGECGTPYRRCTWAAKEKKLFFVLAKPRPVLLSSS